MSLTGKVFAVAFVFVILIGTVALVAVHLNNTSKEDPAYKDANSSLNQTDNTITQWTAPQVAELGWVAFLLLVFTLCTGLLVFVLIKGKRKT